MQCLCVYLYIEYFVREHFHVFNEKHVKMKGHEDMLAFAESLSDGIPTSLITRLRYREFPSDSRVGRTSDEHIEFYASMDPSEEESDYFLEESIAKEVEDSLTQAELEATVDADEHESKKIKLITSPPTNDDIDERIDVTTTSEDPLLFSRWPRQLLERLTSWNVPSPSAIMARKDDGVIIWWMRSTLRISDNASLSAAMWMARNLSLPLVALVRQ